MSVDISRSLKETYFAHILFNRIAIPGPRDGFWVFIIGPILGAIAGAALYELLLGVAFAVKDTK